MTTGGMVSLDGFGIAHYGIMVDLMASNKNIKAQQQQQQTGFFFAPNWSHAATAAIARHLNARLILATGPVDHIIRKKKRQKAKNALCFQLGWCHLVGLHFTIGNKPTIHTVSTMNSIALHRQ